MALKVALQKHQSVLEGFSLEGVVLGGVLLPGVVLERVALDRAIFFEVDKYPVVRN